MTGVQTCALPICDDPREREEKRNSKRVERALKTKDVSWLITDEETDDIPEDMWKY